MAGNKNTTAVYIDPVDKEIHFYLNDSGKIINNSTAYKAADFSAEFYKLFGVALFEFTKKFTPAGVPDATIILPDNLIFTDVLSFPSIGKSALKSSIQRTIVANYKNSKDLKINNYIAQQNKQTASCCISGVRNDILTNLRTSCAAGRISARNITFASNSTINAVNTINPKLKALSYLFLDIKNDMTRFIYVYKGTAVGFYTMPVGYSILEKGRPVSEDLLVDHSVAELAVLNAKEKAKAKALTMMGEDTADALNMETENEENDNPFSNADPLTVNRTEGLVKTLPKKTARKLPRFMLRETPDNPNGIAYENFRIFVKWALCFIAGNKKLAGLAPASAVYINMPPQYKFLLDMTNTEEKENGIKFLYADLDKEKSDIRDHLELYGGLFTKRMNAMNNF